MSTPITVVTQYRFIVWLHTRLDNAAGAERPLYRRILRRERARFQALLAAADIINAAPLDI